MSLIRTLLVASVMASTFVSCNPGGKPELVLSGGAGNDLFLVLRNSGIDCERYDDPHEAIDQASRGSGVLLLAQGYPDSTTPVSAELLQKAASKGLRLYVEYPGWLPGGDTVRPRDAKVERAVVQSSFFGPDLPPLRILSVNGLRFIPTAAGNPHLVAAQVAGFDSAVYGLPMLTYPLLYEEPSDSLLLVATTRLSGFVTGRYAPGDAWRTVWKGILKWLAPGANIPRLEWEPTVRPTYGPTATLPPHAEAEAVKRGVEWFVKSKLLIHPSRREEVWGAIPQGTFLPTPPPDAPVGDGSLGIMEAKMSVIQQDGSQLQSASLRGDCHGESAMALAFGGTLLGNSQYKAAAGNLLDYWYFKSGARDGARSHPDSSAYGLVAWGVGSWPWFKANYGDDNARLMLGTLAAAALMQESRWDEVVTRCLLANLRTTGKLGFRGDRIEVEDLAVRRWKEYFNRDIVSYSPHNEAYLWACFLWAFDKTGDSLFLKRTENALRMTMAIYPNGWRWMNGLAQERARILLPLAWLVRVSDTPEHRQWLRTAVDGLLALQDPSGAIREELGPEGNGRMYPPKTNEAYGTHEASLIQQNGEPVSDQLYTTNFALLGLHEAAALGDSASVRGADRLAEYFIRTQIRSDVHPALDGGWFRAFDFQRWESWGSNADVGWGAWAIETGWTQGWIASVLALRQMRTSFWDLTAGTKIGVGYEKIRKEML